MHRVGIYHPKLIYIERSCLRVPFYWVADNTHCSPCGFTFTIVMKLSEETEGPFGYDYKSYVRSFANTPLSANS